MSSQPYAERAFLPSEAPSGQEIVRFAQKAVEDQLAQSRDRRVRIRHYSGDRFFAYWDSTIQRRSRGTHEGTAESLVAYADAWRMLAALLDTEEQRLVERVSAFTDPRSRTRAGEPARDESFKAALQLELADPKWDFRTMEGLGRALQQPPPVIEAYLLEHPDLVRWVPATDSEGRVLLIDARRHMSWRERAMHFRAALSKSIP